MTAGADFDEVLGHFRGMTGSAQAFRHRALIAGADVVAAARMHLGTEWRHQGRLPGVALDCAGLVIVVARELGLVPADFDVNDYAPSPDGSMPALCEQHMQPLEQIELGAVLVLATQVQPQHLGIVGDYAHGGWSLIHACNAGHPARVIETRLMFARNLQLRGIYRLPGVSA